MYIQGLRIYIFATYRFLEDSLLVRRERYLDNRPFRGCARDFQIKNNNLKKSPLDGTTICSVKRRQIENLNFFRFQIIMNVYLLSFV